MRLKKAAIGLLMGGMLATPAMAWEKGDKVPELGGYEAPALQHVVYNTPTGIIERQTYTKDGNPVFNSFSRECKGKMEKYAYFDFERQEVMLDNDPLDGTIDSVYRDKFEAPRPFMAVPKCE